MSCLVIYSPTSSDGIKLFTEKIDKSFKMPLNPELQEKVEQAWEEVSDFYRDNRHQSQFGNAKYRLILILPGKHNHKTQFASIFL